MNHPSRYDMMIHKKLIVTLIELITCSNEVESDLEWSLDISKVALRAIERFNEQVAIATEGMKCDNVTCTLADVCDVIVSGRGRVISHRISQTEQISSCSIKEWASFNSSFISTIIELIAGTTSLMSNGDGILNSTEVNKIKEIIIGKVWQEVGREVVMKLESSLTNERDIENIQQMLRDIGKII